MIWTTISFEREMQFILCVNNFIHCRQSDFDLVVQSCRLALHTESFEILALVLASTTAQFELRAYCSKGCLNKIHRKVVNQVIAQPLRQ